MQQIKIEKTVENKDKPFCKMNDWTTVHWRGYLNGALVEDSRQYMEGKPKVFKLGHFEVSECWDIAIQQIRQGENATVLCPGSLDKGKGNDENTKLTADLDETSATIPANSDMKYEFEVIECGVNPPSL
jgi:FKBP-type peptidyl-prolyl cis-trans isomerase